VAVGFFDLVDGAAVDRADCAVVADDGNHDAPPKKLVAGGGVIDAEAFEAGAERRALDALLVRDAQA